MSIRIAYIWTKRHEFEDFCHFREIGVYIYMDKTSVLKMYEIHFSKIIFLVKNHNIVAYINIFLRFWAVLPDKLNIKITKLSQNKCFILRVKKYVTFVKFCHNLHAQSVKAMRFPPRSYHDPLSAEERRQREQEDLELAKEMVDEDDDMF